MYFYNVSSVEGPPTQFARFPPYAILVFPTNLIFLATRDNLTGRAKSLLPFSKLIIGKSQVFQCARMCICAPAPSPLPPSQKGKTLFSI